MPTVLAILAEGFEEIEFTTPVDLLCRAGAVVTTAALGTNQLVTGRSGLTLRADTTLATLEENHPKNPGLLSFDCLLLPGGPGVKLLRADSRIRLLVLAQHSAARWIAAICAAPTILLDAGVLTGRCYTAHFSVARELPNIIQNERTVTDGHIITSRGAGTSLDFGLLLVEKLFSPEKSSEIALSICA